MVAGLEYTGLLKICISSPSDMLSYTVLALRPRLGEDPYDLLFRECALRTQLSSYRGCTRPAYLPANRSAC